jgi:lipid A 4'-phosphatase
MKSFEHLKILKVTAVIFVSMIVLFILAPSIDIAVSGAFFRADDGFYLANNEFLTTFRFAMWRLMLVFLCVSMMLMLIGLLWRRDIFGIRTQLWVMITALFILGPGVLVNLVLKSVSGRARPADVTLFGGDANFTPAWLFSDQCVSNCSFVSGEGSGAAALVISGVLVLLELRSRLGDFWLRIGTTALVLLGVMAAAQRVATGRHFLSDTVFAILLIFGLAVVLHGLIVDKVSRQTLVSQAKLRLRTFL